MKKFIQIMVLTLAVFTMNPGNTNAQTKIGDVILPNKLTLGGEDFVLNGGGIREKFFLDLYVGSLYVKSKTNSADKVMNGDAPMLIHLHIVSGMITSDKMITAVDEGFEKSTNGNSAKFSKEIAMFKDAFKEEIKENDSFDIMYMPGKGTIIYKNGKVIKTIPGLEFKKALFGIWFCNEPADDDLKEGMLGL